jgi:hypothetical protein
MQMQLASRIKTLHTAKRLATGNILPLGRMTDCVLISTPSEKLAVYREAG